ncbi:DUF6090 family protein [Winogradskyella ouciana]|uniref:DUF6090 family protein n=1 Tax=Winogradskyella ouciana TaxID=2608631 RepID=UPI003D2CF2F2
MIKFFRRIRYKLMEQNKTSKYFKYAIGEIVLVVIGILIALSINNWNEKQKEKNQIRNIYARIVKDFENSSKEIERDVAVMEARFSLMDRIIREEVNRDSLLTNTDYFQEYFFSTTGFPDIKIIDTGVRVLESKIELNYELNNELSEALSLLYSQLLFEIEIDEKFLTNKFSELTSHIQYKGIRVDYRINNNRSTFVDMIFEDDLFKSHFFAYSRSHRAYSRLLNKFKTRGTILMDKIKTEYHIE